VILERENFDAWLADGGTELPVPAENGILRRWPVSKRAVRACLMMIQADRCGGAEMR
jgi:hypothetical protein